MCGRFTLTNPDRLPKRFNIQQPELPLQARYNIAPTQNVPVVVQDDKKENKLELLQWGLLPFWSKEPKRIAINARIEGITKQPAFRKPDKVTVMLGLGLWVL